MGANVFAQDINERLSKATTYTSKVKLLNDIIVAFPKTSSPNTKEELTAAVKTLVPQLKYNDLCKKIADLKGLGLITQEQLTVLIEELIATAKLLTNDRSEINDLLTKANLLSDNIDDTVQKNKFLAEINDVVAMQLKQDQTAIEKKIRTYFNGAIPEHKTYENCIEIMVYNVLSSKGSLLAIFENEEKELFAEIVLGTPKRNMEDGLWARIKDVPSIPAEAAGLVQLVFLCGNDKIMYKGQLYEPSKLLTILFSYEIDTYNMQFLNAVNNADKLAEDYSIEILKRNFPLSGLISDKEVFKNIERTTLRSLE